MVQTVQQTTEIPQMPFVFRWSMPLLSRFSASQVVCLRTQRTAWFDSGYMRCVSLRSILFSTCMVDYGTSGRFSTCSFSALAWFNSKYKFMRQSTWLVFLVTMHLALSSFVVLRPLMLDIMAGMDHVAWFAGILRCPSRCAPLVVSGPRCPSSWPAWTTGQYGGSQVQFLDKVFYMPVIVLRVVSWSRQCSALFGLSAVAVHHGRRHSLSIRRGRSPWSWLFR